MPNDWWHSVANAAASARVAAHGAWPRARGIWWNVFGVQPVRQWVLSFPYPLRLLFASKPDAIGPVLGIMQRAIAGWLADRAGVKANAARTGAVTLIQRFGGALNLNVHLHMLWLDGVYDPNAARADKPRLHRVRAPTSAQLTELAGKIAHRVCRHLARKGWLEGEGESAFLSDSAGGNACGNKAPTPSTRSVSHDN
jgi:hypothetical protein